MSISLYSKGIKLVLFNVLIVTPLVILPCQNFFPDRYFHLSELLKFPIIYFIYFFINIIRFITLLTSRYQ